MVKNRWRAAPIHLALSALVAATIFAIAYFVWYPGAMFDSAGGRDLFLLIAGVDVTVGPLVTLIIFDPRKRWLKLDLAIIAVIQLAALAYGTHVLFEARPVWTVYVKDRFELVRANEIDEAERAKAKPPFDALSLTGPRLAAARLPTNPDEQFNLAISAAGGGRDVQSYPRYYIPYEDARSQVTAHARPIARLADYNPGRTADIAALPARFGLPEARLGFLPMRAGKRDLTVIVDRSNASYLGTLGLKPWQY